MSAKKERSARKPFVVSQDYFPSSGAPLVFLIRAVSQGKIAVSEYKTRDESIGNAIRAGLINAKDGEVTPTKKLVEIVKGLAQDQIDEHAKQEAKLKAYEQRHEKLKAKLARTAELMAGLKKSA